MALSAQAANISSLATQARDRILALKEQFRLAEDARVVLANALQKSAVLEKKSMASGCADVIAQFRDDCIQRVANAINEAAADATARIDEIFNDAETETDEPAGKE